MHKERVDVVEEGEVGVYFDDPVGEGEDDGDDEDAARVGGQEGLDLHPRDDVVQAPGHVERDGADGEPPSVDGVIEEDPEAVPDAEEQLEEDELV